MLRVEDTLENSSPLGLLKSGDDDFGDGEKGEEQKGEPKLLAGPGKDGVSGGVDEVYARDGPQHGINLQNGAPHIRRYSTK